MNIIKRAILKTIFPRLPADMHYITRLMEIMSEKTSHQVVNVNHLVWAFDNQQAYLQKCLEGHAICLDALMSLVAINEQDQWSTVMAEDTVLPEELQTYLNELVARA